MPLLYGNSDVRWTASSGLLSLVRGSRRCMPIRNDGMASKNASLSRSGLVESRMGAVAWAFGCRPVSHSHCTTSYETIAWMRAPPAVRPPKGACPSIRPPVGIWAEEGARSRRQAALRCGRSDLQMRNGAIDRDVVETAVGMHAEIGHVVKHVGRPGTAGKFDVQEIGPADVAEPE